MSSLAEHFNSVSSKFPETQLCNVTRKTRPFCRYRRLRLGVQICRHPMGPCSAKKAEQLEWSEREDGLLQKNSHFPMKVLENLLPTKTRDQIEAKLEEYGLEFDRFRHMIKEAPQ